VAPDSRHEAKWLDGFLLNVRNSFVDRIGGKDQLKARILVPIDFTRESAKPLRYAALLAETHGGRVLLLHVTAPIKLCVDCGYGPVNREGEDEVQKAQDCSRLRRFAVRHLQPELLGEILVRSGAAAEEILRVAREVKADMIVLCAHETAEENSIRSHETVERVTRLAPCPVLVVRRHEQDFVADGAHSR